MMPHDKLLPCPFCGGDASHCVTIAKVHYIECVLCKAQSATVQHHHSWEDGFAKKVAHEYWNARHACQHALCTKIQAEYGVVPSVQTVLKRDSTAEKKKLIEARTLAAGYETYEEAQNAYGYEEITMAQLEAIRDLLENPLQNKAHEALKRLGWVIGMLEGEVNTILYGDEQELRIERYFEELEWKKQQTE